MWAVRTVEESAGSGSMGGRDNTDMEKDIDDLRVHSETDGRCRFVEMLRRKQSSATGSFGIRYKWEGLPTEQETP